MIELNTLKTNPGNPRYISPDRVEKLKQSIEQFPKMMALRPIVVDSSNVVLGGNMRLKALQELGYKSIPGEWVKRADELTEEEKRRFIIADNTGFGEWDFDILANEWEAVELEAWGLDLPGWEENTEQDNPYTEKIKAPTYEPNGEKPEAGSLFDNEKTLQLIEKIKASKIDQVTKDFLIKAAERHTVFNYEKIADFYAHSGLEVQKLMEDSTLIIIDYEKAIEQGYVEIKEAVSGFYANDYNDEE